VDDSVDRRMVTRKSRRSGGNAGEPVPTD